MSVHNNTDSKDTLLLFSGGRDSFLAACLLLEQGRRVRMVTFENGAGLQPWNAQHGASRIIERYGADRANFLGVASVAGFWREFFLPYFNLTPSEVLAEYGELTISQFHCLTCRVAMYLWSICYARQESITSIADGARHDQGFVVELPEFLAAFRALLAKHSIELLLPVYDLDSDQYRKNLLLLRGFTPKVIEPQCLIGVPLRDGAPPSEAVRTAAMRFYEKAMMPKINALLSSDYVAVLEHTATIL